MMQNFFSKYHKILVLFCFVSAGVLSCTSSKKSDPKPSFTVKTQYLNGTWKLTGLLFGNSIDSLTSEPITGIYATSANTLTFTANADDQGTYVSADGTATGTWALTNNETVLSVTQAGATSPTQITISNLTATTLTFLILGNVNYVYPNATIQAFTVEERILTKQ